jgi:glutathione S-transferase
MSLVLWGRASSVNVQKVLWALDEFGLTYEHRIVGGKYGGLDTPEFKALTPVGVVPVLQDGDMAIWESHAILRHLARRPGSSRAPSWANDVALAARVDPWLEFGATTLQPPFIAMFWQMVRMKPDQRDTAAQAVHTAAIRRALGIIEARFEKKPTAYLAGPDFSIADIGTGSVLYRLFDILPDLAAEFPRVCAWRDTLAKRPGWARHIATSYDELRVT